MKKVTGNYGEGDLSLKEMKSCNGIYLSSSVGQCFRKTINSKLVHIEILKAIIVLTGCNFYIHQQNHVRYCFAFFFYRLALHLKTFFLFICGSDLF